MILKAFIVINIADSFLMFSLQIIFSNSNWVIHWCSDFVMFVMSIMDKYIAREAKVM